MTRHAILIKKMCFNAERLPIFRKKQKRMRRRVAVPHELALLAGDVYVLAGEKEPDEAERLLVGAFKICAPIMRRRSWRIGTLCEMIPSRSSIYGLNENAGQTIRIRLREPGDGSQALEFHTVLHTLLHELCHNVHQNHSAEFYDLLDEISDEAASVKFRQGAVPSSRGADSFARARGKTTGWARVSTGASGAEAPGWEAAPAAAGSSIWVRAARWAARRACTARARRARQRGRRWRAQRRTRRRTGRVLARATTTMRAS